MFYIPGGFFRISKPSTCSTSQVGSGLNNNTSKVTSKNCHFLGATCYVVVSEFQKQLTKPQIPKKMFVPILGSVPSYIPKEMHDFRFFRNIGNPMPDSKKGMSRCERKNESLHLSNSKGNQKKIFSSFLHTSWWTLLMLQKSGKLTGWGGAKTRRK